MFAANWTNGTMDAVLRCRCTTWPSSARNDALLRNTPSRLPGTSSRHTPRSASLLGESINRRWDCGRLPQPSMRSLQVSKAKVRVEEQPWKRLQMNGTPHDHGEVQQVNVCSPWTYLAGQCPAGRYKSLSLSQLGLSSVDGS